MILYPHIPQNLEDRVNRELESGESIRWIERPAPRFFTSAAKGTFYFGILWTSFAIFWTCKAAGDSMHGRSLYPLFGIPFILIGLGMMSSPLQAYRKSLKTIYIITNRRAIIIEIGWTTTICSYGPNQMQHVFSRDRRNGTGDVFCDSDGDPRSRDLVFWGVREAQEVERMLKALAATRSVSDRDRGANNIRPFKNEESVNPHPQIPRKMDARIYRELQSGESVLWIARPVPQIFTADTTGQMIFGIPIVSLTLYWLCGFIGSWRNFIESWKILLVLLIPLSLILAGFISLSLAPFFHYLNALRTAYVITNRRALIFEGDWAMTSRRYTPENLKNIYRKERRNGTGDVILGYLRMRKARSWTELGFLNIRAARDAEQRLKALSETPVAQQS